jgi:hypothetical protein
LFAVIAASRFGTFSGIEKQKTAFLRMGFINQSQALEDCWQKQENSNSGGGGGGPFPDSITGADE